MIDAILHNVDFRHDRLVGLAERLVDFVISGTFCFAGVLLHRFRFLREVRIFCEACIFIRQVECFCISELRRKGLRLFFGLGGYGIPLLRGISGAVLLAGCVLILRRRTGLLIPSGLTARVLRVGSGVRGIGPRFFILRLHRFHAAAAVVTVAVSLPLLGAFSHALLALRPGDAQGRPLRNGRNGNVDILLCSVRKLRGTLLLFCLACLGVRLLRRAVRETLPLTS